MRFPLIAALAVFSLPIGAQPAHRLAELPRGLAFASPGAPPLRVVHFAPVPFGVGEELTYRVTFGRLPAGSASMRIEGIDMIRGRAAYHVVFSIDGGVPFFRVHDRYESWIDVETLASLRHVQQISEGRYSRTTRYEIFPDRAQYQENDGPMQPSVAHPLDDGSFIYAIRASAIQAGERRVDDRYFRPDRNPVVLAGLRTEEVSVGAGSYPSVVVRPTIRANGLFAEGGDAEVWFSDDAARYPVLVKSRFARFSLSMALESVTPGEVMASR